MLSEIEKLLPPNLGPSLLRRIGPPWHKKTPFAYSIFLRIVEINDTLRRLPSRKKLTLIPRQNIPAAQVAELRAAGAAKVYAETASGAKTDRAELAKVLRILQPGDVLMVTRLDRLARSTRDLLNTLHALAERQVGFKSLVDSWADTAARASDADRSGRPG